MCVCLRMSVLATCCSIRGCSAYVERVNYWKRSKAAHVHTEVHRVVFIHQLIRFHCISTHKRLYCTLHVTARTRHCAHITTPIPGHVQWHTTAVEQ
jgi:hypothetical protein